MVEAVGLGRGARVDDLRPGDEADARGIQLVDEVPRHARRERRAAHHQRHRSCVAREVQRGLPGRVAAADDEHVAARLRPRLHRGGAVEDRGADERLQPGRGEPPIRDARGEHHGAGPHDVAAGHVELEPAVDDAHARHPAGVREPRPEDPRLLVGALGELGARDAAGEPEVVADQRTRPRLPADRLALEHERPEPLGCRVHRRGEAGRARPDDGELDVAIGQGGLEAVGAGQLGVVGIDEHPAVGGAHERHARVLDAHGREHRHRVGRRTDRGGRWARRPARGGSAARACAAGPPRRSP